MLPLKRDNLKRNHPVKTDNVNNLFRVFAVCCLCVVIQSCASYGQHAVTMRDGLLTGRPDLSLAIAEKKDLEQEEVISSLDKGMLRRMTDDYRGSKQIKRKRQQSAQKGGFE